MLSRARAASEVADWDTYLGFGTNKVVWIRDRWLGAVHYGLIVGVFAYVVCVRLLWRNEHFLRGDVNGLPRLHSSPPTLDNCDPMNEGCRVTYRGIGDLLYCEAPGQSYTHPKDMRANCKYSSGLGSDTQEKLFIPTAVEVITEKRVCTPAADNRYVCPREYAPLHKSDCLAPDGYLCKKRGNQTGQFYYLADVENIRIRFTSSYERDDIRGTSLMHAAYVGICDRMERHTGEDGAPPCTTWGERKRLSARQCASDELRIEKVPCQRGVACHSLKSFDVFEATGIGRLAAALTGGDGAWPVVGAVGAAILPAPHGPVGAAAPQGAPAPGAAAGPTPAATPAASLLQARSERATTVIDEEADGPREAQVYKHPPSAGPGIVSDSWGDVFTLGRLLELAGVDLDRDLNMDNWTARQSGTALEVRVVYNNLYPMLSSFGYRPVMYHYEVQELVLPYVSETHDSAVQPEDFPAERAQEQRYGVLIHFKVSGSFGILNFMYCTIMVTTAFALVSAVPVATDFFALYVHPRGNNFFHTKYEMSPDHSKMWRCSVCGYLNENDVDVCQGVPTFTDPKEVAVCGAARGAAG